jgi:predicted unusual protein kinase regulating ubiquinone biosynthesis (AarF/ABC1/UbiB family)
VRRVIEPHLEARVGKVFADIDETPFALSSLVKRLAPALDAGAVLAELRERVSDELDYEAEAQHQQRLERMFRGHPLVRVPRLHGRATCRLAIRGGGRGRPPASAQ